MKSLNPFKWFQKGGPVKARYEGAQFSTERSWLPGLTQDAIKDITSGARLELMRRARYFEKNSPLTQRILDLIETNVVGNGITVTPTSSSADYNNAAKAWFREWSKYADQTSRQNFGTLQGIIARAQACDGEIFVWLTYGDSGRPRIQLIESHRVKSPGIGTLPSQFRGYIDCDGVLLDSRGRPAFYCIHNEVDIPSGPRAGTTAIIPAAEIVHFFEPSRAGQVRGVTLFHAAIVTLHDLDDLQRYEMAAAKDAASRANIVTTKSGELPDAGDPVGASLRVSKPDGTFEDKVVYYQRAFGGKTIALKDGDTWEQSQSLRPSAAMREFWEYLTKQACRAVGISYAAVDDYQALGGASLRAALASDNRFYEIRTRVLTDGIQRIYEFALSYANRGEIGTEVPADWHRAEYQSPRRATADVGRESKAMLEELRAGARTYQEILGEIGRDWKEVLRQRAEEEAFIDEMAGEYGIDRTRIAALGPNERMPMQAEAEPAIGVRAKHISLRASEPKSVVAFLSEQSTAIEFSADQLPTEFVWMPKGSHSITAGTPTGETWSGKVVCDEAGYRSVVAAFNAATAQGRRTWIDFNHEDAEAAAWVKGFSWDATRGILCHVEWTKAGEASLRDKVFYSFSPAFLASENGRVSGLLLGHAAGGLVNAPAFGAAMPALVAARLGTEPTKTTAPGGKPEPTNMKEMLLKLLAALAVTAPADATEEQLIALCASHVAKAKPSDEVASLKSQLEAVQASAKKTAEDLAAVQAAAAKPVQAAAAPVVPAPVVVAPGVDTAVQASSEPGSLDALRIMAKENDHKKRAAIYAGSLKKFVSQSGVLEILAANSLGSMAGALVLSRALDLLKIELPILSNISTDFSAEAIKFNQAVNTRLRSVPSVTSYNTTTGYADSDATTVDVPVTINQHKAVQIAFQTHELGSTNRDLFGEQVEGAMYALSKDITDALYALILIAQFTNATTKALVSFARADVTAMEKAMSNRGVASMRRMLLLNSDYFEKLGQDATLVQLAAFQRPEVITDIVLPPVAGFNVKRAVNMPTTGNLTGFGFTPDALAMAARLPADYAKVFGAGVDGGGTTEVFSHAETGLSFLVAKYINHDLAKAKWRAAFQYGVAVGDPAKGQILKSA